MSPGGFSLRSQILAAFFLFGLLVGLRVSRLHLGEGEVAEDAHQRTAGTEIDSRLLDE